jgi:signal transduction histidine kinase
MTTDAPVDLTVDEHADGVVVLALRFHCGNEGAARVALSTYRSGRPLPADVCAALATRLHDAKNELVACAAASRNAVAAIGRTDRLRHLLSGSQHLDGALGHLRTVQELLGVDRTINPEELDLLAFFRLLTTELLTWVPRSVSVVPPDNLEEAIFVTDPHGLRAAIVNLCRNSVEAMEGKGYPRIAWSIDGLDQLHVFVEDSGPGFTREQLGRLNAGEVLASTKQTGSGSGLLSVRLLLDRLAGRVVFRSLEHGARVELVVPAAPVPAVEDADTGEVDL